MSVSLSLALSYRKSGDIENALLYLKKACELENDGLALYYMADAYEYGGWGLERNLQKSLVYARRSWKAGNPYGSWMYGSKMNVEYKEREEPPFPRDDENHDFNDLRLYANEGDGPCQIKLALELWDKKGENIDYLLESSLKQCVYDAYEFAGYYYSQNGKNLKMGLTYLSKTRNDEILRDLPKNLKLMYAIGWAYSINLFKESPYSDRNERRIYFEIYETVSNALTAWFIICKRIGLNKDLTKLIAQYILKFAEDPEEWGIYLE